MHMPKKYITKKERYELARNSMLRLNTESEEVRAAIRHIYQLQDSQEMKKMILSLSTEFNISYGQAAEIVEYERVKYGLPKRFGSLGAMYQFLAAKSNREL